MAAVLPESVAVYVGSGLVQRARIGQLQPLLVGRFGLVGLFSFTSQCGVAYAEEMLVHHEGGAILVGYAYALLVFGEGIG